MAKPIKKLSKEEFDNIWRLRPDTFAVRNSEKAWQRYKYLNYIGGEVAKAALTGGRLIVECPPRHGKSELISFWTPMWFLSLFPNKKVILASYEAEFAALWGRRCRDYALEHERIGIEVNKDALASSRWETVQGGGMTTAGAGGPLTGKGGNLLIIDDIIKNSEQASSAAYQQRNIEWFQSTFATRAEPGAGIIVLGTRWNESDLQGWLQNDQEQKGKWKVIRLPAVAEDSDVMGRDVGMALCPERYNEEKLLQIKREVGAYYWAAMYQQRPAPLEGGIFKRAWFKSYTSETLPPDMDEYIQSWDLAFTGNIKSAFTVGQVWARKGANKYLIDQVRGQYDFVQTVDAFHYLTNKHPQARIKLVEKAANGEAILASLKEKIPGMIGIKAVKSKEDRALSIQPDFESGNVYFPEIGTRPWLGEFIEEVAAFPNSKYKDQADSMVQALMRFNKRNHTDINFASITKKSFSRGL